MMLSALCGWSHVILFQNKRQRKNKAKQKSTLLHGSSFNPTNLFPVNRMKHKGSNHIITKGEGPRLEPQLSDIRGVLLMTIQILSSDSNTMAEFVLMIWVGFLFMAFKNLAEAKKIWFLYGKPVCLKEKKRGRQK